MEPKAVLYLLMALGYVVFTLIKKAQESKSQENKPQPTRQSQPYNPSKPVTPPTGNPLDDLMREIKQKKAQAEAEKARQVLASKPKPLTTAQPKKEPRELLVHAKQKGVFQEGNYERDLTAEEKIERGKLKIANEGIYKIKSIEEAEQEERGYELDVRSAIIGATILERKH